MQSNATNIEKIHAASKELIEANNSLHAYVTDAVGLLCNIDDDRVDEILNILNNALSLTGRYSNVNQQGGS